MKKHLLIALMMCIGLSSIAAPWDLETSHKKELDVKKPFGKAFTDPYVRIYAAYDLQFGTFYHRVRVDVEFNETVGVPYYAVIRVYGDFYSTGEYYRDYTLYLSGAQWRKSEEFSLLWNEEVYTEVTELVDYGPQ